MEFENVNPQSKDHEELIIEFPELFSAPKFNHSQLVEIYVEEFFRRVSKLSNHPFKRVGFIADVPIMKSVLTKLLLDYEKVLMDGFIRHLDDAATQIQDDPGYSQGPLADASGGPRS